MVNNTIVQGFVHHQINQAIVSSLNNLNMQRVMLINMSQGFSQS